jgi:hypothetical protein
MEAALKAGLTTSVRATELRVNMRVKSLAVNLPVIGSPWRLKRMKS